MILEIVSNFSLGDGTPVRDLRFSEQKIRLSRSGFCVPIDTTLIPLFRGIKMGLTFLNYRIGLVEAAGVEPAS
jgi:hypothetical protein